MCPSFTSGAGASAVSFLPTGVNYESRERNFRNESSADMGPIRCITHLCDDKWIRADRLVVQVGPKLTL